MHRLEGGQPIRAAMEREELTLEQVAARTRELDPKGKGLSVALIGFYTSTGRSARETASKRTARLLAAAVNSEVSELFRSG